ncbi:recombinase family protein [Streptococcus mitis]|uniref:Recombinase family protein n=1 Tax=Streptococcus mitis TaxID=28037 RepID=A0A4U1LA95_STRMT|nr:recombinase family protein [Streptococcus mitis]
MKFMFLDKYKKANRIIKHEQAKVVRYIFDRFLEGYSPEFISKELRELEIPGCTGKAKWCPSAIWKMLQNEKYKGDAFLQKTYTVDFLKKKRIDNDRQVNQYYIEQNHEPILDREKWEIVQLEIARRKKFRDQHKLQFYIMQKENNPFTTKVFCAECASAFGRKNWTTSRGKRKVWECNNLYRIKGQIGCQNNHIDEEMLETIFLRAIEELKDNKNLLFERWKRLQEEGNLLEQMYGDRLKHLMSQENLEFNGEVMCQVLDHIKLTIDGSITIVFLEETEVTL